MQASSAYYGLFEVMAKQSPLNTLRTLELSADQLKRLAILCRALRHHDLAGLVNAEADMRGMLEKKKLVARWLN